MRTSTNQVCYTADSHCVVPGPPPSWLRRCCLLLSGVVYCRKFPFFVCTSFFSSIKSVGMGKKEEEEIIRIAKKMDKMAQKKNGVRCLRGLNAVLAEHANGANFITNGMSESSVEANLACLQSILTNPGMYLPVYWLFITRPWKYI